jgi:hypothetical protein
MQVVAAPLAGHRVRVRSGGREGDPLPGCSRGSRRRTCPRWGDRSGGSGSPREPGRADAEDGNRADRALSRASLWEPTK